jgi:putative transposase
MREDGLRSKTRRKYRVTTDSNHNLPVAENLLERKFEQEAPNRAWTSDITYIWTQEGWLYLAVVLDLFSRKAVGWSMSERITRELVADALKMAVDRRLPEAGLLYHSDRGSQYTSEDFQNLLAAYGMVCSMSRKGNCWDNAVAESFFGTIKKELIFHESYRSREAARKSIFEYIEVWYNRKRRHSSLGYLSPEAFERGAAVAECRAL